MMRKLRLFTTSEQNTLTCALSTSEFDKIVQCKIAKKIWDTLKVSHEKTDQVKESKKINILIYQYELFKMQDHESIEEMISKFTVIINDRKSLGKTYTNQ